MAYIHKEGSFTLSDNDRKERDNQPDMRGKGTLNGKPFKVSAWKRKFPNGGSYLSLIVQEDTYNRQEQPASSKQSPKETAPEEDDVPF